MYLLLNQQLIHSPRGGDFESRAGSTAWVVPALFAHRLFWCCIKDVTHTCAHLTPRASKDESTVCSLQEDGLSCREVVLS